MHRTITAVGGLLLGLSLLGPGALAQERLTLEEAVRLALQNNYAIQVARNEAGIAANDHTLGNAGFLPSLSLNAGQNNSITNTQQRFAGDQGEIDRTGARTSRQNAGASLNWTLFDGLGRFATYERLEQQRTRQEMSTEAVTETVVADVIVSYFDLIRLRLQVEVLEEAVAVDQERLRIAELRRDLGSASELDVRQAQLDLNADQAALLRQRTTLANAKANFNQLLARSGSLDYVVEDTIIVNPALELAELAPAAFAENRTLQVAEQDQIVADLERRELRADYFPRVDLDLGYGYTNLESQSGFLQANRSLDFTYGVALSYDLFDGFNRSRRLQNARLREESAALLYEDVRSQLEAELASQYNSYQNSLQLIALEQESLEITRLNVEVALERFRLGTTTSVELREVQETRISAQLRLIVAQFEAKRAETELLRLSGRLPVR